MVTKSKIILFVLLLFIFVACSSSDDAVNDDPISEEIIEEEEGKEEEEGMVVNEEDFYTEPTSYAVTKNLVTDYGADTIFSTDDSAVLQTAIDDINSLGGGKLIIPSGNYSFAEVNLNSNVHLEIDANAVLRPTELEIKRNKNYVMFRVTNDSSISPLENVSICGVNGKFTVDLTETDQDFLKIRIIQSYNVSNFKYSDFIVYDNYSQFSTVEFNGVKIGDSVYGPRYGVVKNIDVFNADYGYGVVQLQLAKNIYFNNLYGKGGATLRIESHNVVLREIGTYDVIDEIYGRDIRSEQGNSALMLSPHFIDNGKVDIRNISSIGSGFAVRVGAGFANPEETALGLTAGSFSSESIIRDITATYASSNAQLKPKHYKFMPCELRQLIETEPINPFPHGDSYHGPSIGGVLYTPNYTVDVSEDNVTATGFVDGWDFIVDGDAVADCE